MKPIDAEIILAEVIGDLYVKYKPGFVDYENRTHKLGWFKEEIKSEFNRRINSRNNNETTNRTQ